MGRDVEYQGLFGAPRIGLIVGEEVNASILKLLALLGLGRHRVKRVPADKLGRMQAQLMPDIEGPTIVYLQAGNEVHTGDLDILCSTAEGN